MALAFGSRVGLMKRLEPGDGRDTSPAHADLTRTDDAPRKGQATGYDKVVLECDRELLREVVRLEPGAGEHVGILLVDVRALVHGS